MTRGVFVSQSRLTAMFSTPTEADSSGVVHVRTARSVVLILGLLICLWGMWTSGREGLAQLLAGRSLMTDRIEEADQALMFNSAIPEVHYVRGSLLYNRDELTEAISEFERAVKLRPRDYALWLQLGRARDRARDVEGALIAFRESARLAPFYAEPHWQLGNTLLRSQRPDEALAELRRAAASNPKLLTPAIHLAWAFLNSDARVVAQAIQPQSATAHMALANFFARHGKSAEAITHFRAAGGVATDQRQIFLNELLAARSFPEAYEVWVSGRRAGGQVSPHGLDSMLNGGFEEPIALDDPGFGWQVGGDSQSVRASLDPASPRVGSYSLRLDWNGDSDPASPVISQLVLVEPNTRYRLSFAARTREMLTVGLPVVTIVDASSETQPVLMQSETFPRGTTGWQDSAIEFATTGSTRAVRIVIRREKCETAPCAAMGQAWVDDFLLEKL
jgi:Tfp pilus assembly protein PilF